MIDLRVRHEGKQMLLALPAFDWELKNLMEQLGVQSLEELTQWEWEPADAEELRVVLPKHYTISQLQLLSAWILESTVQQYRDFLAQATITPHTMEQLLTLAKNLGGTAVWERTKKESQLL